MGPRTPPHPPPPGRSSLARPGPPAGAEREVSGPRKAGNAALPTAGKPPGVNRYVPCTQGHKLGFQDKKRNQVSRERSNMPNMTGAQELVFSQVTLTLNSL